MARFPLPAQKGFCRRAPGARWRARALALGLWAGAVGASGCGQGVLDEAAHPSPERGRLLVASGVLRAPPAEKLQARIDLFGIRLASLESTLCHSEPDLPATLETRVTAAPLLNVIRTVGGEAKTELSESQAPLSSEYHFREGDILRHYQVNYREGTYTYVYDNGGASQLTGEDAVPEGAAAHDLQSAMLLLRSWRPRLGELGYFYVVLGRRLWRVDVTSAGPQVIKTEGSPRLTHRIDGVAARLWEPSEAAPRHFTLWLSEDGARVPVRMLADASFGQVTMTLTERGSGGPECAPRPLPLASVLAPAPNPPASRVGQAWHTLDRFPAAARAD
jgi:uncharacterized protein DUF3108